MKTSFKKFELVVLEKNIILVRTWTWALWFTIYHTNHSATMNLVYWKFEIKIILIIHFIWIYSDKLMCLVYDKHGLYFSAYKSLIYELRSIPSQHLGTIVWGCWNRYISQNKILGETIVYFNGRMCEKIVCYWDVCLY